MVIYLVVKNEIKRSLKNKKKLAITLIAPVLAVFLAICINVIMKPSINLGVINKENSSIGSSFIVNSENIEGIKVEQAKEETINTDLIMAKYVAVIEFKENNHIKLYCLDKELKDSIEEIVNYFADTKELTGLQDMLIKMKKEDMTSTERSSGFIVLTLVITCIIIACNIIKDREDGVLKRYIISANIPQAYILGNFIFNFLFASLEIIISTVMIGLLKLNIDISVIMFFIIGIVAAFIASSIATLVVCLVDTELKSSLIASAFAMFMSLLGGAFLPLEKMPEAIKIISNISITKWLIVFTKALENKVYTVGQLMPVIVIILMSAVFVFISLIVGKRKFV